MKQIRTFGECLDGIMRVRGISAQRLADLLNYKSKTSVVRVLRDQSNRESREKLFAGISGLDLFSHAKLRALSEALEVSRVGRDSAGMRAMLRRALFSADEHAEAVNPALAGALKALEEAHSAHIIVIECCWPHLFERLRSILEKRPRHRLDHFVGIGSRKNQTMSTLCSLMCIAHMGSYSCNALMADEETCDSLKGRNMICFCAQDREGRSVDTLIIFSDAHSAVTLSLPTDQGLFDFARRIVAQRRYAPVVSCYEPFEGPVTFVDQMRFCTEMERDANWALVTPYLCINAVPTHIVRSALTDGGVLHSFPQLDERRVRVYLEEFLYFHSLRYKALFSSAHLRGHIASRQSMRRFALTGMLDDEYLPVRPLTTQERLAVLQGLLDLMRNDERFVLRFRRNESNLGIRAYCFSETGVLTHPIKTISSLYMNYRASIIRHPRLVELFEECFWDDLLRNHALSREESVAYLEGLVRELREGA